MSRSKAIVQFSLVEFLVVVSVGFVALGSIWSPSPGDQILLTCVWVSLMGMTALVWIVDGERKAFLIGFLVFAYGYVATTLLFSSLASQMDIGPRLPSQLVWDKVYEGIVRYEYFVEGKLVDPASGPTVDRVGQVFDRHGNKLGMLGSQASLFSSTLVTRVAYPDWQTFHMAGHTLWLLLLGYFGGKFAVAGFHMQENRKGKETSVEQSLSP
ncbi:hypothetical protein [Bremerella cremea]|uniref:hypothetical protein n=1 Tax=Bremerella cremea TaxID=1031537 RepID=UPI0031ECD426